MCEVTWNTWGTCERSWCQCMNLNALKILSYRSLSFLLSVSVVVLWLSSLIDARTLSWLKPTQVCAFIHSIVILMFYACVEWPLRPLQSLHLLSLHLSYLPALLAALHILLLWCRGLQARALPLRSWVPRTRRTPPQVMSPTTTGVCDRATVPCRRRLRWHHHRSDAPQCVPKTSRSLWRRKPVVLSVVIVNESWLNGETRCLPWRKSRARSRNWETKLWKRTD